jgi:hypothetical protein
MLLNIWYTHNPVTQISALRPKHVPFITVFVCLRILSG